MSARAAVLVFTSCLLGLTNCSSDEVRTEDVGEKIMQYDCSSESSELENTCNLLIEENLVGSLLKTFSNTHFCRGFLKKYITVTERLI